MSKVKIPESEVWDLLSEVLDPEIPVLNVVDMGIVRDVQYEGDQLVVTITPTYSGCPAMKTIEEDIEEILREKFVSDYRVAVTLSPAWTTDWITESARQKLLEYGIAPPEDTTSNKASLTGSEKQIACPQCKSTNTEMISQFGSTACKALWKCKDCLEPFDYFKCI